MTSYCQLRDPAYLRSPVSFAIFFTIFLGALTIAMIVVNGSGSDLVRPGHDNSGIDGRVTAAAAHVTTHWRSSGTKFERQHRHLPPLLLSLHRRSRKRKWCSGSGGNSSSSSSGGGACGSADAVVEAGADSTAVLVSDSAGYRVCVEVLVSPRLRRCARVQFWWMAAAVLESVGPCRYSPAQTF